MNNKQLPYQDLIAALCEQGAEFVPLCNSGKMSNRKRPSGSWGKNAPSATADEVIQSILDSGTIGIAIRPGTCGFVCYDIDARKDDNGKLIKAADDGALLKELGEASLSYKSVSQNGIHLWYSASDEIIRCGDTNWAFGGEVGELKTDGYIIIPKREIAAALEQIYAKQKEQPALTSKALYARTIKEARSKATSEAKFQTIGQAIEVITKAPQGEKFTILRSVIMSAVNAGATENTLKPLIEKAIEIGHSKGKVNSLVASAIAQVQSEAAARPPPRGKEWQPSKLLENMRQRQRRVIAALTLCNHSDERYEVLRQALKDSANVGDKGLWQICKVIEWLLEHGAQANIQNIEDGLAQKGYNEAQKELQTIQAILPDITEADAAIEAAAAEAPVLQQDALTRKLERDAVLFLDSIRNDEPDSAAWQRMNAAREAEARLGARRRSSTAKATAELAMAEFHKRVNKPVIEVPLIPSGLNEATKGARPGELTIIAADTGVGKTSLALCMMNILIERSLAERRAMIKEALGKDDAPIEERRAIEEYIRGKHPPEHEPQILMFTLEIEKALCFDRLVSIRSGLFAKKILHGCSRKDGIETPLEQRDLEKYHQQVFEAQDWPVRFYDMDDAPNMGAIEALIAAHRTQQGGLRAVFIDFLQSIELEEYEAKGLDLYQQMARIAKRVAWAAKRNKVPIIGLSQLKRENKQHNIENVTVASLANSAELERRAGIVLAFGRTQEVGQVGPEGRIEMTMKLLKNRQGDYLPGGDIRMQFAAWVCRFEDGQPRGADDEIPGSV